MRIRDDGCFIDGLDKNRAILVILGITKSCFILLDANGSKKEEKPEFTINVSIMFWKVKFRCL